MKTDRKLELWKDRLRQAENERAGEMEAMTRREALYDGKHVAYDAKGNAAGKEPIHVRNVCMEMIETQVDSTIPSPKVSAVRPEDEEKAKIIENMIRDVLDRLPMERLNDEAERISPIQGGHGLLVGWDADARGCDWMGQLTISLLHPREILPQPGIYQIEDMDWIITAEAKTKRQIKKRFGVDVSDETEEDARTRTADGGTDTTGELVTLYSGYFRNDEGGIGRCCWVGEQLLESLEDYQLRRVHVCRTCGAAGDGKACRYCGGKKWDAEERRFLELQEDVVTALGTRISARQGALDELGMPRFQETPAAEGAAGTLLPQLLPGGMAAPIVPRRALTEPTRIPYYKPDMFPVILRKNVSKTGKFLGGSDVDAIFDQQNGANKIGSKIMEKVLSSGSFTTIPEGAGNFVEDSDRKVLRIKDPKSFGMIRTFSTQASIEEDLRLRQDLYEEARQTIGVTDSMQGRRDPTATSAVAKEFSARQAAGRMESKRIMKQAMYQDLFELIFRFMLAYCDAPRQVRSTGSSGRPEYLTFDPRDFLYQDSGGQWMWNTDFLFSCDDTAPLQRDRQAMWQETRLNFRDGAFGAPNEPQTLLRFWEQMAVLHYPMAGAMASQFRRELQDRAAQAEQAAMQEAAQQIAPGQTSPVAPGPNGGAAAAELMRAVLPVIGDGAAQGGMSDAMQ